MGSRHSAQTLQLREFLSRNGHPYTYVDLDTDRTSQELLDRFDVKLSEVPVVICNGRNVLRNPSIQELANCLGLNSSIDAHAGARSDHRRRGPGGTRGGGLCGVGRSGRSGDRDRSSRRAGGIELQDRELSGISDRRLRTGTGDPRHHPGAEVRRQDDDRAQRGAAQLRPPAVRGGAGQRRLRCRARRS